jgi:ligand-binding sensor domain-containing protein
MCLRCLLFICVLLTGFSAEAQQKSISSASLAGDVVKAIYIGSDGTKWFGTDQGLSVFDGISWFNYGTGSFLPYPSINDLWLDEAKLPATIWLAASGGLTVAEYSMGEFSNTTSYTLSDGLLGNDILSLGRDNLGTQYAASSAGINFRENNTWNSIIYSAFPGNIPNAPVRKIHTHNDSLYVATSGGIGRFVNTVDGITGASRWTSEYGITPLSGDITAVFVDSKGNQWFGTSAGLEKHEGSYAKSGWSLFTVSEGLVNNYILDINESPTGEIWVATKGGVSIYKNPGWQSIQRNDGLVCDTVYDIAFDQDGSAWLATHKGVSHYLSGSFENYIAGLDKIKDILPMRIDILPGGEQVDFVFDLSKPQWISLSVYTISGQLVSVIGSKTLPAGRNTLSWKLFPGTLNSQQGIFIIRFQSPDLVFSNKFLLIR